MSQGQRSVHVQEVTRVQAQLRALPTSSPPLLRGNVVKQLGRAGHMALAGSGLRVSDVGALVVSAGPELELRPWVLASELAESLHLADAQAAGFGGPLSFYHALFFAAQAVTAGHFTHVLLVHVLVRAEGREAQLVACASVVGQTPQQLRYLGVAFGSAPDAAAGRTRALAALEAHGAGTLAGADVSFGDDPVDQGTGGLFVERGRPPGTRLAIGACARGHFGAAAFELAAPVTADLSGPDSSLDAYLRRARAAEIPLSLLRVEVDLPDEVRHNRFIRAEITGRIRLSIRAFDDVLELPDASFLVVLPRAGAGSLERTRHRVLAALGELDPAGELSVGLKCRDLTLMPGAEVGLAEVERALGTPLAAR